MTSDLQGVQSPLLSPGRFTGLQGHLSILKGSRGCRDRRGMTETQTENSKVISGFCLVVGSSFTVAVILDDLGRGEKRKRNQEGCETQGQTVHNP